MFGVVLSNPAFPLVEIAKKVQQIYAEENQPCREAMSHAKKVLASVYVHVVEAEDLDQQEKLVGKKGWIYDGLSLLNLSSPFLVICHSSVLTTAQCMSHTGHSRVNPTLIKGEPFYTLYTTRP